jgi:hypothetical protein
MIIPHKLSQVAACETIWTISLIDPKRTGRERFLDHSISPRSFQPTTIRLAEIEPVSGNL